MDKLWQAIVESIKYLWPFVIVHQWERGIYTVFGRYVRPWRVVGFSFRQLPMVLEPGLYIRVPFFTQLKEVTIAWDFVETGRLDLTLKDDRPLTCEVTAMARVSDPVLAYFQYHDFEMDLKRALRIATSDVLSDADPERFAPNRRGRLLGQSLEAALQAAATEVGHEIRRVGVTTFIPQPQMHRLLMDAKAPTVTEE